MVNRLVSYHLYAVAALSENFLVILSQHQGRHNPNIKEFTKLNIGLKVERKKENLKSNKIKIPRCRRAK